ncbi:MAG: hypothetical protein IJ352_08235 [Muribaculaceae bacterium]|nr:hypothetical protein [Muribaculaceae bacterium]
MKTTQITTYIVEVENKDNWLTQKDNDNILLSTFTKKVIVENENDGDNWVEISETEKQAIELEIMKIKGEENEKEVNE